VPVGGEVQGRIHTAHSAPVIDLSVSGALLEVFVALKPGTIYTFRLPVEQDELTLRAKVVRSQVVGFQKNERGESVMRYRTAVEFVDVAAAQRAQLERHVTKTGGFEAEFETDFDFDGGEGR
jgi:hypothetical protein